MHVLHDVGADGEGGGRGSEVSENGERKRTITDK